MTPIIQYKALLGNLKKEKEALIKQFNTQYALIKQFNTQYALIKQFNTQYALDDAKFAKIELNIIDVFEKMLYASEKQVSSSADDYQVAFSKVYLNYFEKIPQNWREHLSECEAYGDIEGAHIEHLKLNQAAALKDAFVTLLKEEANE